MRCSAIRPRSNAPSKAAVRAWCWACAITCSDVRFNEGMPSQAKQGALRVGEDLAVTSGAVVYRDAVCEVIQSVVAY
jgi:Poly-beta-hydroxybutyrate polymerase (PhaC) N-terminus